MRKSDSLSRSDCLGCQNVGRVKPSDEPLVAGDIDPAVEMMAQVDARHRCDVRECAAAIVSQSERWTV